MKDSRYDQALERAKELHEAGNALTKSQIEIVFPELKESEDERIRKHIIEILERLSPCHWDGNEKSECIAYLERQEEQKILPGFDELTPDEEMSHPLYLKGFDAGRNLQMVLQQPAEWSEEEERHLYNAIEAVKYVYDISEGTNGFKCIEFLKSFRPQPHWKPSKEQMDHLAYAYTQLKLQKCYAPHVYESLGSLYDDLKKLI